MIKIMQKLIQYWEISQFEYSYYTKCFSNQFRNLFRR